MTQRVQKILSQWGIASRRQAEKLILAGRVRLNGKVITLGQTADLTIDELEVDGQLLQPNNRPQFIYVLLNKPVGVISTCEDPRNRRTVLDLLPPQLRNGQGIHPVGRLDIDSTGALLMTNDGALTETLTHPRYHLPKTYQVWVQGHPSESVLQKWREGIMLLGKKTLPAQVNILKRHHQQTLLQVILTEGRNRQIRRIAQHLGFEVLKLHRSAIGLIQLHPSNDLPLSRGDYRFLKDFEIHFLKNYINLAKRKEAVLIQ